MDYVNVHINIHIKITLMERKKNRAVLAKYRSYKYPKLKGDPEFASRLGMEVQTSLFFSEIVEDFDLHISPNAIRGRIEVIERRFTKYFYSYTRDSYFSMTGEEKFARGIYGGNAYKLKPKMYKLFAILDIQLRWIRFCPAPRSFKDRWILELNELLKQIVDLAKQYQGNTIYSR